MGDVVTYKVLGYVVGLLIAFALGYLFLGEFVRWSITCSLTLICPLPFEEYWRPAYEFFRF